MRKNRDGIRQFFRNKPAAAAGSDPTGPILPPPTGTLYGANKTFNPSSFYTGEAAKFVTAFKNMEDKVRAGQSSYPKPDSGKADFGTIGYPDKVNLSNLRSPKIYWYMCMNIMGLTGDPYFLETAFRFVREVMNKLETNWVEWPHSILPGTWKLNSSGQKIVHDPYSSDTGKVWGVDRSPASGYTRATVWGTYDGSLSAAQKRQSPMMRNNRSKERTSYKKLLYLRNNCEAGGIAAWGTHLHELDNLLGHGWLFWAGYCLDANRHIDAKYGTVGQECYDYCFTHFGPLTEFESPRHATLKIFKFNKSLYHNVAAHKAIYDARAAWKRLRATRSGTTLSPQDIDVVAAKNMMSIIIDSITLHNLPSGMSNYVTSSENYKVLSHSHHNPIYGGRVNGTPKSSGPAVSGYDDEFGSEALGFYLRQETDDTGRIFGAAIMGAASVTYGAIVERNNVQPGSSNVFNKNVAKNVACGTGGGTKNANTFEGKASLVKYGGSSLSQTNVGSKAEGFAQHALTGGAYHVVDPTPNRINTIRWLRRVKYSSQSSQRLNVQNILDNPAHSSNAVWQAVGLLAIHALINPSKPIADLLSSVGTYQS